MKWALWFAYRSGKVEDRKEKFIGVLYGKEFPGHYFDFFLSPDFSGEM